MKKSILSPALFLLTALVVVLSVWGPETLASYTDRGILNQIHTREEETGGEGYRYQLSSNEKLYILSQCLNAQSQPETEQSARIRQLDTAYQDLAGTYAFVVNHNGPSGKEITNEEIYETANEGIAVLKENGIRTHILQKISSGSDEIPAAIRQGHLAYIINTSGIGQTHTEKDGQKIRMLATEYNVNLFTSLDTVSALLDVLEAISSRISTIDAQ